MELGCGLGLPSLAAALGGADVLATDWSPDAIDLLRTNAEQNGAVLDTEIVGWATPELLVERAPFDLVLASDVLYERRNADELLDLLPKLGDEVLVADPSRPFTKSFRSSSEAIMSAKSPASLPTTPAIPPFTSLAEARNRTEGRRPVASFDLPPVRSW